MKDECAKTKVIRLDLPMKVASLLEAEAGGGERPIFFQAARITSNYLEKQS
ncbi:MAG: hypothetical protein WCE52_00175 [Candidatus Acidiferrum sp.]